MSRKYNVDLRLQRAYVKYLEDYGKKVLRLVEKGYKPADMIALSFEDFVASRQAYRAEGVAPGNITSKIISRQLYAIDRTSAQNVLRELRSMGVTELEGGEKLTIDLIRTDTSKNYLSIINDKLKAEGMMSGYQRSNWITENIFGDSE